MPKIPTKKQNAVQLDDNATQPVGPDVPGPENDHLFAGLSEQDQEKLLQQIETEYTFSWWFMKPRWDEWALRIRLYNNQRRDKEAVGDPLLFTIHQTILASLYNDKLGVTFSAREIGDQEVAENLNIISEFDYEAMQKDEVDYQWDWDALFFGCGLVMLMEFDRDLMIPIPENLDPMTIFRDPRCKSINGDLRNRGRARFFGREMRATKYDLEDSGQYKNLDDLKFDNIDLRSFIDNEERVKQDAYGYANTTQFMGLKGANQDYRCTEWFTFFKGTGDSKAKLVFATVANARKLLIRFQIMEENEIPIIERRIYPNGDFDGVSIPDLVEDKQRARSVLQNLAVKTVKAGLHPMYLFNSGLVKRDQLNFDFNKFVEVSGNPTAAVSEMPRAHVQSDVSSIMEMLNGTAQQATATPSIQQGQFQENTTATETNQVAHGVDTRYSLSAKIFGWSEKRFWITWYKLYKRYFKADIDEKVVRIAGVLGPSWRPFTRENLIGNIDPDVKIESKKLSDAERFNKLANYRAFLQTIATDPNANMRAGEKAMGRLMGLHKDEIDEVLPPVVEEMKADEENIRLEAGEQVDVLPTDDHLIHIHEHNKCSDTPQKIAHMNAHKRALILQRSAPQAFGNIPPSAANPTQGAPLETTPIQRPATGITNAPQATNKPTNL